LLPKPQNPNIIFKEFIVNVLIKIYENVNYNYFK